MSSSTGIGFAMQELAGLTKAKEAASSVFRIIDRQPKISVSNSSDKILNNVQGSITFEKVYFVFPTRPKHVVFHFLDLSIKAGETIAFVGISGVGKSTALSLILRLYDPLRGRVLLDGEDIRELNLSWLRQRIVIINSNPIIFSGTIASNIAYGFEGATIEQVIAK